MLIFLEIVEKEEELSADLSSEVSSDEEGGSTLSERVPNALVSSILR